MEKPIDIDYKQKKVTVSLTDEPAVLIMDRGEARLLYLHEYGELAVKTSGGKISHYLVTESGKL